ncbi:hypothetical protein D8674_017877 [Pyrus ussuriensis x Pyrus communis]|uniref:Uncharacterized protein n=1 Tax=Pyrus ussuriensis x Pyrus communis TaxID=2448454 RepID=A0A5N5HH55_9ROSA|nr:hypothetical protein D8674_017877 [Pyrus ussuriensis x Pyrus communis]
MGGYGGEVGGYGGGFKWVGGGVGYGGGGVGMVRGRGGGMGTWTGWVVGDEARYWREGWGRVRWWWGGGGRGSGLRNYAKKL